MLAVAEAGFSVLAHDTWIDNLAVNSILVVFANCAIRSLIGYGRTGSGRSLRLSLRPAHWPGLASGLPADQCADSKEV